MASRPVVSGAAKRPLWTEDEEEVRTLHWEAVRRQRQETQKVDSASQLPALLRAPGASDLLHASPFNLPFYLSLFKSILALTIFAKDNHLLCLGIPTCQISASVTCSSTPPDRCASFNITLNRWVYNPLLSSSPSTTGETALILERYTHFLKMRISLSAWHSLAVGPCPLVVT